MGHLPKVRDLMTRRSGCDHNVWEPCDVCQRLARAEDDYQKLWEETRYAVDNIGELERRVRQLEEALEQIELLSEDPATAPLGEIAREARVSWKVER